jgi:hypothetical protein
MGQFSVLALQKHTELKEVMLSLCLLKHHTIIMYGEVEVQLCTLLTLALHGSEWSALCPGHSTCWGMEAGLTLEPVWTRYV